MDLAAIQEVYDKYGLYYMPVYRTGSLITIEHIRYLWEKDPKIIVINSLHIAALPQLIKRFLNDLGYNDSFFQQEVNKGILSNTTSVTDPVLSQALIRHDTLMQKYLFFSFFPAVDIPPEPAQITRILEVLRPKIKINAMPLPLRKLVLQSPPSESLCSTALREYTHFSFPWNENKYIIEYLMEQPPSFISTVLGYYGIDRIDDTIDTFYDLASLLNQEPPIIHKNIDDISYLSSLNVDQLISLAIQLDQRILLRSYSYKAYPWGHAYLLYGMLTGNFDSQYAQFIGPIKNYKVFINFEPYKISALLRYFYAANKLGPSYQYFMSMSQSPRALSDQLKQLFQLVSSSSVNDIDSIIDQYEMVPPPNMTNSFDKFYYYAGAIRFYHNVLTRPPNFPLPPPLVGLSLDEAQNLLYSYTDKELLASYPIPDIWKKRSNLVNLIFENYRGPVWRTVVDDCRNDDTFNIIEDELHGAINKHNYLDPTFSYGTYHNYRCYQASELLASFYEDETGFHLNVPDWINPMLGIGRVGSELREFPAKSMVQLIEQIQEGPVNQLLQSLIEKINLGLSKIDLVQEELNQNIQVYESFSESEKQWATIYLVWLFLFSMWMRFWKGPGYPYPYTTRSEEYCEPPTRDEHIILQLYVRDPLLERAGEKVIEWVKQLPIIKFDWKTPNIIQVQQQGTLETTLLKVQEGKECQGIAGDTLSATAYGLIKYMFNYDDIRLNEFVNKWTLLVNELEKEIISRQMPILERQIQGKPVAERTQTLWKVYNDRLTELNKGKMIQEPFDPKKMQYTQHV